MRQTLLNQAPDIDWLFMVHIPSFMGTDIQSRALLAILYGNEDSPTKVELFEVDHYKALPFATFAQNEEGNLIRSHAYAGMFVRSIHGETDTDECDRERTTGKDAWGHIGEWIGDESGGYSVNFPNGVSVILTDDELAKRQDYRVTPALEVARILNEHKAY